MPKLGIRSGLLWLVLVLALAAGPAEALNFIVTSTGDAVDANPGNGVCATAGAVCTLRAAIMEINARAGGDTIQFNLGAAGPYTISPASALPAINKTVTIDAYTGQPGASANTLAVGDNAALMVVLIGSGAGAGANGLVINSSAPNTTIKGLVINGFAAKGIQVNANGVTIRGNFIGTNAAGTAALTNGTGGIGLSNASGNTIGGTAPADRNLVSGNNAANMRGIELWDSSNNTFQGNYVGTDKTGTAPLPNGGGGSGAGIALDGSVGVGSDNNLIGGAVAGAGNLLSGGGGEGLYISADSNTNTIQGNTIGLNATGTAALANALEGIKIQSATNTVGGDTALKRNVISGNTGAGIRLELATATGNLVQGNYIGTDSTGTLDLGNLSHGVILSGGATGNTIGGSPAARNVISGNGSGAGVQGVRIDGAGTTNNVVSANFIGTDVAGTGAVPNSAGGIAITNAAANNTIGGVAAGAGNRIAFNTTYGVNVATGAGTGNAILGNAIVGNTALGIDLGNNGVTPNDPLDGDTGPNDLLNFPALTAATVSGGSVTVSFQLDVPAASYRIEFFKNPSGADPLGYGEGEIFVGSRNLTHAGGGALSFSFSYSGAAGDIITATTTACTDGATCAAFGSTSEFSNALTVSCCALSTAEVPGSTVTVTGAAQFEMVFRQAAGASLDSFFDLAEDPTRTYDLAGRPASEFRGLFHSSIVSGGLLYVTGQNNNGPQLDLLEATPTRVRTRSATFYQRRPSSGSSAILPGLKAIVDYSVYPSGRLGVHWNRRVTTDVSYTDHPLELAVHYEVLPDPRGSLVGYSQSGATFPAPASDAFVLARFDAAGARTDFLGVISQPWPAADSLDFSGSPSPYFFSWRDVTPTTLTAAANPSDSWNFLTYFKPTNLLDNVDAAVTSRSADYLTPSSITLLKGQRWLDGTQNTGGSDDYNEAEGAYVLGMDPTPGQGLQFRIDGTAANPRYSPFFKVRKWRSFVESPSVTLDGTQLVKNVTYRANVKPLARAHWASTLSWHCTMESTSACNSGNLDVGTGTAGSTTGTTAVAGRYGNGLLFTANTDKVTASSTDFNPSIGAVEFWYQPRYDSADGLRYLLWYAQGGAGTFNCYAFEKTTGNTLLFWVRIGATNNLCTLGGFSTYSTSVSVAAGTAFAWRPYDWVHLKASWNSAGGTKKLRIAVNGVEAATSGTFSAPGGSSTPAFGGCSLNCPVSSPGNPDGILDEVNIYGGLELGGYDTNTPIAHAGLTSDASEYLADTSKNWTLGLTPVAAGSNGGSYFYFGSDSPFLGLNVGLQTPGAWSTTPGDLVWEYWDGAKWRSLESGFNFTDTTNQLTQTGTLYWDDPSTWTPYSVNGGPDLYYVRVHLAAGLLTYSTQPVERLIETDILLFQYCGDITAAAREFNFAVPAPTAVKLQSFAAVAGDGSVVLEWRTGSELDNLGFHLYRSLSEGGPWTRLTASLIPGLGSSAIGQAYSFRDAGLVNGVRYFYRLEDVDASSKTTSHGPVSAVPVAGAAGAASGSEPEASSANGKKKDGSSPSCPDWVVSAYGSMAGASSAASLTCTRHGDPEAVSLGVVSRDARQATLELRTGGFWALHTLSGAGEASGKVRVFVPGFDFPQDPQAAALPFRRALVDAVVGRTVQLGGVRASDQVGFAGLVPASLGKAEMQVSLDGTVRASRRALPERTPQHVSTDLARLLPSVFQGETKSAVVVLTPLRYDARRKQLLLSKRLLVRLLFTGRETGESGRGSYGRRERPQKHVSGAVLARLYTTGRGLHAVSFEQLFPGRRRGFGATELRLERQGEAVGFHLEPGGSLFGPGSVLYFYAETEASSTDFSSETAWELVHASGVPLPLVSAAPSGDAVTTASIGQSSFETNRYYQPGLLEAPELWLWDALGSGTTRVESFALAGVDAASSQAAELEVFLQGASESGNAIDHHVSVSLNGTLAGEAQSAGKKPFRMSLTVPASLLREGANELSLTNVADTGVSSMVFLDRFTVSYPQASSLASGRFEGTWAESGTATVSGAGGPAALLDVTPSARWLAGYDNAGGALRFRVEAGHRYLAVSPQALLTPRVATSAPSTLRATTNQADYLLIAPGAFLAAAEPLLQRRRDQGLQARAVAFEEVAEEFGHGRPSAEAIQSFLAYAFQSWARPSPRYVLLLGDASYDPRHFMATSLASPLPALWTKTSYLWTASDPLLAAVNGDDALPDLAIGRLPATTVAEANALVQKLIAWEDSGQGLGGAAALVADNPDLGGDFEADIDDIARSFLQGRPVSTIKLGQLGAGTRPAIQDALNSGLSYLSYVGHGGAAVWASENVWNSWDAVSLLAQSRQPFLLTMNCLNGYFVAPSFNSLAESLLKVEGRGAIASFSPSGLSEDGPAHQYHRALLAELTSGQHERLGDALLAAQRAYAQTGLMPELLAVYHLLGDPAMRIR